MEEKIKGKLQFFIQVIHFYWDELPQEMQKDINEWYEKNRRKPKKDEGKGL